MGKKCVDPITHWLKSGGGVEGGGGDIESCLAIEGSAGLAVVLDDRRRRQQCFQARCCSSSTLSTKDTADTASMKTMKTFFSVGLDT